MRRHNREVREHFRDRPDDLLVIDLTRDGRWEPICEFLGHPVPGPAVSALQQAGSSAPAAGRTGDREGLERASPGACGPVPVTAQAVPRLPVSRFRRFCSCWRRLKATTSAGSSVRMFFQAAQV